MICSRNLAVVGAILSVSALALGCSGCKGSENGANNGGGAGQSGNGATIRVGEYGSMTGNQAAFGKSTDEGSKLAIEEINKKGGVNGKQLELVGPEDDASVQQQGEVAVKRLVEKGVNAVIGEVASGISMAGGPVCQKAQIPMISPSSTNERVTQIGDYIFRVCFIDSFQGGVIAKFAADTLKAKNAAILYDAALPYAVGIRKEFTDAFAKRGGKIIAESSYTSGDKDFKAQLTKLKAANPDVIVVPGYYTEAGTILKQARDLGITCPLLGGDGWDNNEFHTYAGNSVGNAFLSTHAAMDDPNPVIQSFVKAYNDKYGHRPDSLAALAYDSVGVLADAAKRAKSISGPDLRDALAQTKDYPGVTGTITINKNRDAEKGAVVLEVKNGAFKFKEAIPKEAIVTK